MTQPNTGIARTQYYGSDSYRNQGQEKDDEVKGRGNSYTTYFRQLDPRLGRWLSLDPKMKNFADKTPYNSYSNNPIIMIDPDGGTDYYSLNGKKIGSDNVENGLIGVVKDEFIVSDIKKGLFELVDNPVNGQTFNGGFIIHKEILFATEKVANKAYSEKGLNREFGSSLIANGSGYTSTGIFEGPVVDLNDADLKSATVSLPVGNISIHSHPTGFGKKSFTVAPSLANEVSGGNSDEESLFPFYDMNIVIGNEKKTTTVVLQEKTEPTHGDNEVRIYGNSVDKEIGKITIEKLAKITKGNKKTEKQ